MDSLTTSHVAQYGALAGLSAWAAWSLWRLAQLRGALQAAAEQLGAATAELQARDKALSAERAGRMRAEQRLTDAKKVHAAALVAAAAAAADGGGDQPLLARLPVEPLLEGGAACHKLLYPMRPIGHIKSCFSQR